MERAQVAIVRCQDYDVERVRSAVREALAVFGGAARIAKPGDRVLLKPNLLRPATPDEAVTTHPVVVEAVAREFREAGAAVALGDSPGGVLERMGKVLGKSGIGSACERAGVEIVNFDGSGSARVPLRDAPAPFVPIARAVRDADVIISLAKLKTHGITELTAAVKNTFGCVPGFVKAEMHKLAPIPEDFARTVCAIAEVVAPRLTIVDGILAMDGDGPSAGDPFDCGYLLAGEDPAAIDRVIYEMVGFDATRGPLIAECRRRRIGVTDLAGIEIAGVPLAEAKVSGFRHGTELGILRLIPRGLIRTISPVMRDLFWIKPRIDPAICTDCGACERSCPTNSIGRDRRGRRIVLRKSCISCLCCQEVCPFHAIDLATSWLAKIVVNSPHTQGKRRGEAPQDPQGG
ncbi:MAG: DUF362 domain-containing protein [Planctomycetes bacterium]|nr:DUF362 domain-containing protein [Planctomycetota bacterium]